MIWSGNVCSANNSQQLLDPYSFTHLLHGFLFFWLIAWLCAAAGSDWQLALAVALEACWEVFENTDFIIDRYRSETAALGYNGDTVLNSFGDILCCLRWALCRPASRTASFVDRLCITRSDFDRLDQG